MNRRNVIAMGVSSLLACTCGYVRRASAKLALQGCRLTAADELSEIRGLLRSTSGIGSLDEFTYWWCDLLRGDIGLHPGFCFYDDAQAPNALAITTGLLPNGPDGTVILGLTLVNREVKAPTDSNDALQKIVMETIWMRWAAPHLAIIIAHEFGHILQYNYGMTPNGPWQMEPHADFLAGWLLARNFPTTGFWNPLARSDPEVLKTSPNMEEINTDLASETMFKLGDTEFANPKHHGEKEFRAAMVRAGYDAKALDSKAAIEKGKLMAGLKS